MTLYHTYTRLLNRDAIAARITAYEAGGIIVAVEIDTKVPGDLMVILSKRIGDNNIHCTRRCALTHRLTEDADALSNCLQAAYEDLIQAITLPSQTWRPQQTWVGGEGGDA